MNILTLVMLCSVVKGSDEGRVAHSVCKHLDDRGGHVGGPHGDHPLSMTHEADSIVGVVAQGSTGAHFGPVLCYGLAGAGVLHISAQTAGNSHTAAHREGMGMLQAPA